MTTGPKPGHPASPPLSLRIELRSAEEPPQGRLVHEARGASTEFTGWLGLVAAIGDVLDREPKI